MRSGLPADCPSGVHPKLTDSCTLLVAPIDATAFAYTILSFANRPLIATLRFICGLLPRELSAYKTLFIPIEV